MTRTLKALAGFLAITGLQVALIPTTSTQAQTDLTRVLLCNGDTSEKNLDAAIMYYSFQKNGWIAQGWYNIQSGKCAYVLNYKGGMFVYAQAGSNIYQGTNSNSKGFCGKKSGFYGYQKTRCRSDEQFYKGILVDIPSHAGEYRFTLGDPQLLRE